MQFSCNVKEMRYSDQKEEQIWIGAIPKRGLDHMGLIYASLNHLVFRLAVPAAVDIPPCICQTGLPRKLVLRVAKALVTL